jgi:hypothetical protein
MDYQEVKSERRGSIATWGSYKGPVVNDQESAAAGVLAVRGRREAMWRAGKETTGKG